jgi:signal transduction histidine kinase
MTNPLAAVVARRTWRATLHVIGDLYVGIVTFTVIITLLALTAGLAITVVLAIPVAWMLFVLARLFGRMERARAATLLGVAVGDPHRPATGSWLQRLRTHGTTSASWKEIGYELLLLPTGVVGASLVVTAWAGSLVLLALPVLVPVMGDRAAHFGLFTVSGGTVWVGAAIGAAGLLVAPYVALGWARLDAAMVRGMLGPSERAQLEARAESLAATRALAVDAAEEERRRIERDLHDGAQQRLVALAMDVGLAKSKFDTDPEAARALLDEAHEEAKRALTELRDLARGIHPVALTDRGLPGAIPGLADRAPFPVDVDVDVPDRPTPAIEGIAYFIVSEALTNVAKHSGATHAAVTIGRGGDQLVVTISDDGTGGANALTGTGLRGLADRVAAVDGTFTVDSPIGGPTVVRAVLPCTVEAHR